MIALASSTDLAEAWRKDFDALSDATTSDVQVGTILGLAVDQFEWQFRQQQRGLLNPDLERIVGFLLGAWFANSHSFPGVWESRKAAYSRDFVTWVEEQRSNA